MQETVQIRANQAAGAEDTPAAPDKSAERSQSTAQDPGALREPPATSWLHGSLTRWHHGWAGSLVIFLGCSLLLIWLFRSEIAAAVEVWSSSETFGHAFFTFPITLFLFYRLRRRLAVLQPRAAPWALIPIAGLTLFWVIGDLANLMVVRQLAFVALWQLLFLLVLGWRVTRAAIFPLTYLYLAVPFGLSVIPVLQDVTAQIVVHLLRFTGMPVFLDGYHIEIPSGSFLIAEACSGVRYLMVCIALGILAANLFFRSWRRRILFVGLSAIVPIIANGIRAYGIVMIAHLSHYTLAVDVDHIVYGFVFLSVVMLSLLGLGALLRDNHHSTLLDTADPPSPPSGATETAAFGRSVQVLCAGLAVAVIFLVQVWTAAAKAPPSDLAAILHGPTVDSPWVFAGEEAPIWSPAFQGMDTKLQQTYRRGEEHVDLHVAYFAYQREGAEAVSDLNKIIGGGSEWKMLGSSQTTLRIADVSLPINALVVRHNDQTLLVWYWYRIGGDNTNSRLAGKMLEIRALASGGERAAAIIAVSTELAENADRLLEAFLQQSLDSNGALFQVETSSTRAATGEREFSPDLTGPSPKP